MKVGDILCDGETRQGVASGSIAHVSGDGADKLNSVSIVGVDDRASADPVYRNPVDEIGMVATSTNVARKEAEGAGGKTRIPEPSNLSSNVQGGATWEEWYKLLWKAKVSRLEEDNRRIGIGV